MFLLLEGWGASQEEAPVCMCYKLVYAMHASCVVGIPVENNRVV